MGNLQEICQTGGRSEFAAQETEWTGDIQPLAPDSGCCSRLFESKTATLRIVIGRLPPVKPPVLQPAGGLPVRNLRSLARRCFQPGQPVHSLTVIYSIIGIQQSTAATRSEQP